MNRSSPQQQNLNKLEAAMQELLVPCTTRVKNATKFVTQCLKQPESVTVLLKVIQCHQNAALRQMSAVFIRKKINSYWKNMNETLRNQAKMLLLTRLRQDPAKSVRRAIAGALAAVGKFQVSNGGRCNEILQHTITASQSENAMDREMSMLLFYFLASEVEDSLADHINQLRDLFVRLLQDKVSAVRIMALKATSQVLEHVSTTEHGISFSGVVPVMLNSVKFAVASGEDGAAVMAFDLLCTLADADGLLLLNPYIKPIMQLILETLSQADCATETRNSALMVFAALVKSKPRAMGKYPHIQQAVQLLVKLVCMGEEEEASDRAARTAAAVAAGVQVSGSPASGTAQYCLDQLALHLPNNIVFPPTVSAVMQCVKSSNCHVRAGGLIALSTIAEGTIRCTREHLHKLMPVVLASAKDGVSSVRRSACVVLGQWIEHIGVGMVEHHTSVLPPVLNLIGDSDASVQEAALYCWENYADNMDPEEVRPYFKPLMNQMSLMLRSGQLQHQVMAFSAIGACAAASKNEFRPYFAQTISVVKQAMSSVEEKSKTLLAARSLECCGQIAVAVGPELFRPHLQDCIRFAQLATKQDETILHDHAISFFSNLCVCFGKEFAPFATQLLPYLFQTVAAMDILQGVQGQDTELGAGFAGFDDDDEEENDETNLKLSVSTANADKKVSAIRCLGAIADYAPAVFATNSSVANEAVKQLHDVLDYWHVEIRCSAIELAAKLFIAIGGGRPPSESEKKLPFRTGLRELTDDVIREMLQTLEHNTEIDAVISTCEAIQDLTNVFGVGFLEPYIKQLLALITLLLQEKTQCQCPEFDEADEDALFNVEQAESLLSTTFDLLGAVAQACGPSFEPHFRPLASLMMPYLETSRPVSQRCLCLGAFAEIMDAIQAAANNGPYADVLLPHIIRGLSVECRGPGQEHDVRNIRRNSSYCASVFVGACGNHSRMLSHFPTLLKCLRPLFVVNHRDDLVVRDNAASALSRMILTAPSALPLLEVLPVLLSSLPLRKDEQENKIVYRSIFMLWKQQNPALLKNMSLLLKILCQALGGVGVKLTPTLQRDLVGLTKSIIEKAKPQLNEFVKSFNSMECGILRKVMQL